jgi:hypothetical protein
MSGECGSTRPARILMTEGELRRDCATALTVGEAGRGIVDGSILDGDAAFSRRSIRSLMPLPRA